MAGGNSESSGSDPGPSTETRVRVDKDERATFHEETASSGRETTEDDIDAVLYGER